MNHFEGRWGGEIILPPPPAAQLLVLPPGSDPPPAAATYELCDEVLLLIPYVIKVVCVRDAGGAYWDSIHRST